MSVDLARDVLNERMRIDEFRRPGSAMHTLVFYGGYLLPTGHGGQPGAHLTKFEGHDTGGRRYRTCAQAWDALMPFFYYHCDMNSDLNGGMHGTAVRAAGEWLAPGQGHSPFDPRGKLVVYGFSAGGFSAMNLCRRIQAYFSWYDFSLKRLVGTPSQPANSRFARVQVDLLITVDPCRVLAPENANPQDMAAGADTRTPGGVVLRHENYWEETDRDYRGVFIDGATNYPNYPVPAGAHDRMPLDTLPYVKTRIRNLLR